MRLRITYATQAELAADVKQMAHGGVLVKDPAASRLAFDTAVVLELVMPDGTTLTSGGKVLQVLGDHGVAVTIEPHVVEHARRIVETGGTPRAPTSSVPPSTRRTPPSGAPVVASPRTGTSSVPPASDSTTYSSVRKTPPSGSPVATPARTASSDQEASTPPSSPSVTPPSARTATTTAVPAWRAPASPPQSEPPVAPETTSARTATTSVPSTWRSPAPASPTSSPPSSSSPVAARTATTLAPAPWRSPAPTPPSGSPIVTPAPARTATTSVPPEWRPPASTTPPAEPPVVSPPPTRTATTSVPPAWRAPASPDEPPVVSSHTAEDAERAGDPASNDPPDDPDDAERPRPTAGEPTRAQKIQLALHGTRDQRNAMLRDRDRGLHAFVLKNPGMTIDDVLAIAKSSQFGAEMYKQISERAEWFQRPAVAVALARNHKVPAEIAIRALAHVAPDALRQIAKGAGAPQHVVQAARKKVIGK